MTDVGIARMGFYAPPRVETAAEVATRSGVPEAVVAEKMGLRQKHVAGDGDTTAQMAVKAARIALQGFDPRDIDLIIYHGSEYKEYFVWSAAVKIQHELGATRAYAFEIYALCAGASVALKTARDMMQADESLRNVLLVTASRENDLVDYANARARFMFNFGAGGGAMLLQRGLARHRILASATIVDGSLSESVIMPAGGARRPASAETVADGLHKLDVPDLEWMSRRLGEVSQPNFIRVIREAVEKSGRRPSEIGFVALTHMKRSAHEAVLAELGLGADQSVYLDMYGHMQSVDAVAALELGVQQGKLRDGMLAVVAAAGTGYTWSATAIDW